MESNKSIRLRTTPGLSQNIQVKIDQDFDTIDFLSLKITQEDAYRNFCSDYGVVAGRVIANDGFGVENAKISIFIPLLDEDSERDEILSIYPYSSPSEVNAQGIRYNLLPKNGKRFYFYQKIPVGQTPETYLGGQYNSVTPLGTFAPNNVWQNATQLGLVPEETPGYNTWRRLVDATHGPRIPVGTLPSKTEILDNDTLLEVYDKYYKLSTRSNSSGDYMIFGVPTGTKIVHMDVDLSDAGSSSLTVDDFINLGFPQNLFNGNNFKSATNLDSLPQIETRDVSVDVVPFWGNLDECEIGITRLDFNLNKVIQPSAYLIGAAFTNKDEYGYIKRQGNIAVIDGINNTYGEFANINNMEPLDVTVEARGSETIEQRFIDGSILMSLPMYQSRKVTDEFGNIVDSPDGLKGIPTSGNYRFSYWGTVTHTDYVVAGEGGFTASHGTNSSCGNQGYGVTMRYDLNNKKRLFYTFGFRVYGNGFGLGGDGTKHQIIYNLNGSNFVNPPALSSTVLVGSFDKYFFGNGNTLIGSMYFPKWGFRSNNNYPSSLIAENVQQPENKIMQYQCTALGINYYIEITDLIRGLRTIELTTVGFRDKIGVKDSTTTSGDGILNQYDDSVTTPTPFPPPFATTNCMATSGSLTNFSYALCRNTKKGKYHFYFGLISNNSPLKKALEFL
jgi:hypothetical protein